MSNHMIGEDMAPVLRHIMELRGEGQITDRAAQALIQDLRDVVGNEDGNYPEAHFEVDRLYCGHCGKRVPDKEPMFSADYCLYNRKLRIDHDDEIFSKYRRYSDQLCADCFDEFMREYPGLEGEDPEKERKYQVKQKQVTIAGRMRW